MRIEERHIVLLCALLCLPLLILLLPAMLIARFGLPKRGVKIALTVSNRWPMFLQYMRLPYDLAILRAGAKVVTIAPRNISNINDLLDKVDGVIISGGEDIVAENQANIDSPNTNLERDILEKQVIEEAERRKMPLFCVCRGMQLLSLLHGGKIACHDEDPDLNQTHISNLRSLGGHIVEISPETKLKIIIGRDRIKVNSFHHQHMTDIGDLVVSAESPDGLIEAVELAGDHFAIGVQWHPELQALFDFREEKLFSALVDAAVEWKNRLDS